MQNLIFVTTLANSPDYLCSFSKRSLINKVTYTEPVEEEVTPTHPSENLSPTEVEPEVIAQKNKIVKNKKMGFWGAFSSTFVTILLAEMGDKTQLATLLMTAESHSPWVVFAGAATALIATSLLGVMLGYWLAKRLPAGIQDKVVAMLLLSVSAWLFWDVIQG
ncbi:MAG: TMEM165/GDT1 family protein [Oscillatoria sp. PMC 1068.18]|nr:TMEM165/GDT1 family protein [Oscillatoria sp. PMC 1076.18]MEC4988922.1 TMEM165/GDT1 family protein [Oscillatoria sp. PMC 1068.18]